MNLARHSFFVLVIGLGAAGLLITASTNAAFAQTEAAAADDAPTGEAAAAEATDGGNATDAYYYVTPDFRHCPAPYCGGVFVRKVNRLFTKCPDGFYRPLCYVAELDTSGLGPAAAPMADDLWRRQVLVRGELRSTTSEGYRGFGRLAATEAWSSPSVSLFGGQVVRVEDSGIQCFTFPCLSLVATEVNGNRSIALAELQYSPCAGDDDEVEAANVQLYSDDGVLVLGRAITVTGPAGEATGAAVSQFFTRLVVADVPDDRPDVQPGADDDSPRAP